MHALVEWLYRILVVSLLVVLIVRQEKNFMTLDDKVTAIEADEVALATTLGVLIADLKAAVPVPQSILDRLDALHVKLQGDNATAVAAETPAAPATPVV
jgi:hypothetical protein